MLGPSLVLHICPSWKACHGCTQVLHPWVGKWGVDLMVSDAKVIFICLFQMPWFLCVPQCEKELGKPSFIYCMSSHLILTPTLWTRYKWPSSTPIILQIRKLSQESSIKLPKRCTDRSTVAHCFAPYLTEDRAQLLPALPPLREETSQSYHLIYFSSLF